MVMNIKKYPWFKDPKGILIKTFFNLNHVVKIVL